MAQNINRIIIINTRDKDESNNNIKVEDKSVIEYGF